MTNNKWKHKWQIKTKKKKDRMKERNFTSLEEKSLSLSHPGSEVCHNLQILCQIYNIRIKCHLVLKWVPKLTLTEAERQQNTTQHNTTMQKEKKWINKTINSITKTKDTICGWREMISDCNTENTSNLLNKPNEDKEQIWAGKLFQSTAALLPPWLKYCVHFLL